VTSLQTGSPINLAISPDQAGIGQTGQRPNVVGDWHQGGGQRLQWFNTAAFALPAAGTWGTLGRNVIPGPGQNNWDASVQKYFNLRENWRL